MAPTQQQPKPPEPAAGPVIQRVKVARKAPKVITIPPDPVAVRATQRGQYGIEGNAIIRNEGEVFEMDTRVMRKWPLAKKEIPIEDAVIIETDLGQFELPGWVELADPDDVTENEVIARGHKSTWHQQTDKDGHRSTEVI